MHLYNFPKYRSRDFYEKVIDKISEVLSEQEGIVSVYQLGGIHDPGISDLDIIAVFEEGLKNEVDPIEHLDDDEKYLFTHSVFGVNEKHFERIIMYNLLNNLQLISGNEIIREKQEMNPLNDAIKRQIALEYLISNVISRVVERFYKLLSVRNILLSAKALKYDLDLLKCEENEPIYDDIHKVMSLRKDWFYLDDRNERFREWYSLFFQNLAEYAKHILKDNPLYLTDHPEFQIGRNIKLVEGSEFDYKTDGFALPPILTSLDKRIRNANNLISNFTFQVPYHRGGHGQLRSRQLFISEIQKYNQRFLPNYSTFANTIALKTSGVNG